MLQSAGFNVTVATTEAAAIAALSSTEVLAVILDSSLSDTPAHLATELKHIRPAVPVLLMTDNAPDETVEAEFDRIICRLDGPSLLLQTLHELTSGVVAVNWRNRQLARGKRAESIKVRGRLVKMRQEMVRHGGCSSQTPAV